MRLFEEHFFEVERQMNAVANKRHIGQRDFEPVYDYMKQALQEIWDVRTK